MYGQSVYISLARILLSCFVGTARYGLFHFAHVHMHENETNI
jgi:hypothetical protein